MPDDTTISPLAAAISAEINRSMIGIIQLEIGRHAADLARQIGGLEARIAALEAAGPVEPPAPAPEPAPEPTPTQSVAWRGATWSIAGGRILRDGISTPDVSLTAGVTRIWVDGDTLLHQTVDGDIWAYTGRADWEKQEPIRIEISGAIGI